MEEIIQRVKDALSEKRFLHSLGVAETAKDLAECWGCDCEKAYLAGILHDIGKELSLGEMQRYVENESLHAEEKKSPDLLHSKVGAVIARQEFKISDEMIIEAIRHHTTGGPEMDLFSKIVYVADYIEPGRKQPGVEDVRAIVQRDLDLSLLKVYERTIDYLQKSKKWIHPNMILGKEKVEKELAERRRR